MSPSSTPRVAVVVPVFNRAHCVIAALDSILAQTLCPAQLIVVDNASSDNSKEVVEQWMKRQKPRCELLLLSEDTPGASAARNRGLAAVTTEWVSFFDSDDLMSPDFLERMVRCAEEPEREWAIARTQMVFEAETTDIAANHMETSIDLVTEHCNIVTRWSTPQPTLMDQILSACISTQSFVAKTALVRRIGGWNAALPLWNDYEIGLRLLLSSPHPAWCEGAFHHIFQHADSITGTNYTHRAEQITQALVSIAQTLQKTADLWEDAQRKKALTALHYRVQIVAGQLLHEHSSQAAATLLQTMKKTLPPPSKIVVFCSWFLRHYVRLGGRGAWRIARIFSNI